MNKLRVGRIWKMTNAKNDEWKYYASFIKQDRDVLRRFNVEHPEWEDTSKSLISTVEVSTLVELRAHSSRLEKNERAGSGEIIELKTLDIPDEIIELMGTFEDGLCDNTLKSYIIHLKNLVAKTGNGSWNKMIFYENDLLHEYILKQPANSQSSIIGTIIRTKKIINKLDLDYFHREFKDAKARQFVEANNRKIKEALEIEFDDLDRDPDGGDDKINGRTFSDLVEIRDKLTVGSIEYLLASIYTMIPAKRVSTISFLSYDKNKRDSNYIDLDSGILTLRNVKNSRYTGVVSQQLPPDLLDVLRSYRSDGWVFETKMKNGKLQKMSPKEINKMLFDIFGIHNNAMRKIHATKLLNDENDICAVARLMDTSVMSIRNHYDKRLLTNGSTSTSKK